MFGREGFTRAGVAEVSKRTSYSHFADRGLLSIGDDAEAATTSPW